MPLRSVVERRACLASLAGALLIACTPPLPEADERRVRTSLSPERLGVEATDPARDWLERLASRVRGRPRPKVYEMAPRKTAVDEARAILAGGWRLRERPPLKLTPPIPWNEFPAGDVNWHYSLNALHPLNPVLLAYEETGRSEFIDAARGTLLDWIDFNITRDQDNDKKWYDMAAGYRAEKLAFILDDAVRTGSTRPEDVALMLEAAVEHTRVLADPEKLPRGNHGLFMMLGLTALCRTMPELANCDERLAYAKKTLSSILEKQFFLDEAIHLEGAPGYHLFMTTTLDRLRRTGLFDDHPQVMGLAKDASRHIYRMFHPNGDPVLVGDSGDSRLTEFVDQSPEARFVLSDGKSGTAPAPSSIHFPKTGYAIFRSPWSETPFSKHSFLFFSAASHDSGHNHHDYFTFEWSERGVPIVVDSGKFTYNRGRERDFFVSTRAGNTVEIDGKNHKPLKALSHLRGFGRAGPLHFAEASARHGSKVQHTRLLVLRMGQWLCVVDRLEAEKEHTYRQWFGFNERAEATVAATGDSLELAMPGGPPVFVQSLGAEPAGPTLVRGRKGRKMQGFVSRAYGKKQPRYSAAFTRKGSTEELVTLLSLDSRPTAPRVTVDDGTLAVSWTRDGKRQGFRYRVENGKGQVAPL